MEKPSDIKNMSDKEQAKVMINATGLLVFDFIICVKGNRRNTFGKKLDEFAELFVEWADSK